MESSKQENIVLKNKECLQVEMFKYQKNLNSFTESMAKKEQLNKELQKHLKLEEQEDNSSLEESDNPASVSTLENKIEGAPTAETATQNSLAETEEEEVLLWTIPEFIIALCHGDDPEYQDEPDAELTPAESHVAGGNESVKVESLETESSPNDKTKALWKEKVDDDHYETNINAQALNQDMQSLTVKEDTESCEVSTNNSSPQTSGEASGTQTATENSVPEADKEKVVLWTIPKIVITLCHDDEPAIPEQPDTELTTAESHVVGEKESVNVESLDNNCLVPASQRICSNDQNMETILPLEKSLTDSRLPNGEKIMQDSPGIEVVKGNQDAKDEGDLTSTSKTDATVPTQGQNKSESSSNENANALWKEKVDDDHYETNINVKALNQNVKTPSTSTESTESQTATENSVPEADKEKVVLWTIPKIVITPCHDDEPAIPEQPDTELTTADSHVVGKKESANVESLDNNCLVPSPQRTCSNDQNTLTDSSLPNREKIIQDSAGAEVMKEKQDANEDNLQSTSKTDAIKPTQGQKKTESSPKDNEASSTPTLLKEIQGAPTAQTATENSVLEADKEKVVLWTIPKIVITLCHDDEPAIQEQPDTELTTADGHVVGEKESVNVDSLANNCLAPSSQRTCSNDKNTSTDSRLPNGEKIMQDSAGVEVVKDNQDAKDEGNLTSTSKTDAIIPKIVITLCHDDEPAIQVQQDTELTTADSNVVGQKESVKVDPPVTSVKQVSLDTVGLEDIENQVKPSSLAKTSAINPTQGKGEIETSSKADTDVKLQKMKDEDHHQSSINVQALNQDVKTLSAFEKSPEDHHDVCKRNAIGNIPTSPRQVAENLVKKNNESYQPAEADHNNYLAAPIEIDDIELFDKLSTGGSEISADEIDIVGECLYTAFNIESWNDGCLVPSCQLTCSDEQNTGDACISKAEVHSNQVSSAGSPPVLEEPRPGYGDVKSVLPLEQALADSHLPVPSVEKVTSDSVGAQIVIEKKNAQDNEITSYEDKPTGSATTYALISTQEQGEAESSPKVVTDEIRKEKTNDDDHYLTDRNVEALNQDVKTPSTSGGSPKDQIVDNSDEVNVTSSNISKMKKNNKGETKPTKEKVKKSKTTKADKKKVKSQSLLMSEKKNAEKDKVSRPKSKKFRHRLFNIFCCCCGKTQESKDL